MQSVKQIKNIHPGWKSTFLTEFSKSYFSALDEQINKASFLPKAEDIYRAFSYFSPENTRVLILGQDPYHGPNQANGLSFSVNKGIPLPPSLKNIYKELKQDLGCNIPNHGDLLKWSEQGVLLLNAALTVNEGDAGSHLKYGWEKFTDTIIETVNEKNNSCSFILWGNFAQKKEKFINPEKHLIIKSSHPSPLGAYRSFFGSSPFSKTNQFLRKKGLQEIDWEIK